MKAEQQPEVGDKAALDVGKGDFEDGWAIETSAIGFKVYLTPPQSPTFSGFLIMSSLHLS